MNVAEIRKLPTRRLRSRTWTIPLLDAEPLPHPWSLPLPAFLGTLQALIWFPKCHHAGLFSETKERSCNQGNQKNGMGERYHKLYSTSLLMIGNVKIQGIGILNTCRMCLYF